MTSGRRAERQTEQALVDRIAREEILPLVSDEIVEEHRNNPFGHHSPDLYQVLTFLRRYEEDRHVIIQLEPHESWAPGILAEERGEPPEILDERYDSLREVQHAIFLKRVAWLRETYGESQEAKSHG